VLLLAAAAHTQVGYWRDGETMARHVILVNPRSRVGYGGLGLALAGKGRHKQAIECYKKAVAINGKDVVTCINLGNSLAITGRLDEAISCYNRVLAVRPADPAAHYNLGRALMLRDKLDRAAQEFAEAVKAQPSFVQAQANLADVEMLRGKRAEAIGHYLQAARFAPYDAGIRFRLAGTLEDLGRMGEAISQYREAIRIDPNRWDAANNLAWILTTSTDPRCFDPHEAIRIAESSSARIRHTQPELLDTLAVAYAAAGQYGPAVAWARRGLDLAESTRQTQVAKEIRARLQIYEARCGGT